MRKNPVLVVFPYAKRHREPKVSTSARARVRDQIRAQPKRLRPIKGSYDLRWQTVKGQFVRFHPGKNLRGVVVVPFAKTQRLSPAEYRQRARRRLSGQRSRLNRWMVKLLLITERIQWLLESRRQRKPTDDSPIYKWYMAFRERLREIDTVDESFNTIRTEVSVWYEKFVERRELALGVSGIATQHLGEVEASFSRIDELLGEPKKPSDWVPCAPFIYPLLKRFKLSPISWDAEVKLVITKYKAARPHELIRVHESDGMAHPAGSANLFIYDKELSDRDLDSYRASSFAMYAVCQLTKLQDEILDKDQRFTNSPTLTKSPIPKLQKVQASPPGRFVLLACPVVIRRGPTAKDKTYREAHDYLFTIPPEKSREQVERRRAYIAERRKTTPKWTAVFEPSDESNKRTLSAEHKTMEGALMLMEKEAKRLGLSGRIGPLTMVGRPSWWGPQFAEFSGQEVWRQIFQRFYWDKGLYVMPRLFLGYTPRGGYRERTYGQEDAR